MVDRLQHSLRWLQNQHAPMGHAAPFAASALFAVGGLSHSTPLRILAYALGTAFAVLIAIDLASGLLESDDQDRHHHTGRIQTLVPLSPFQFVLAAIQAIIYTFLIFTGLGPATPFIFLIPVFVFSVLAAWRNVRLWYLQGTEFASRIYDLQAEEAVHSHSKSVQVSHQIR